ncbi:MAG TPA: UvrD-helicase domain-containing protein [Anaerolineaceae bacterium]|nr:UvrD-helicase domain-containing protein [Anaerolineaceae bacterium]
MDILANLNPQQREAVTAGLGQILVLAGPGSGKTRVLTQRIAYLIQTMEVPPFHILAVTFTNKAAREMEHRLGGSLGNQLEGIWLGTFHSVCARLLRREANYLPFTSSFVIMDADDQETLVKRAVKELNLNDKLYRPSALHAAISAAKNDLVLAEDYPVRTYRDEVVSRVYKRYEEMLRTSNAVDFDDLLIWTVRLLVDNPSVRERYARRFEHVLVDEFQDTNRAQYELLMLLSSYHRNLFVVGDEDQSIYRWRGADYRNVLRFETDYPECRKILLEQNYRSTQTVLNAARAVIDRNRHRTPKHLFSDRGDGNRIVIHEAVDDHAEAAFVVDSIRQMLDAGAARGGDFAVMYRTNAQSRLVEEAFLHSGLPYRLVGAQRFYGRREVKDIIAYLRLVQNPDDEISLQRVINVPPRGIGDKTLIALQMAARQANSTPGRLLLDLGRNGEDSSHWKTFSGRGAIVLADFGGLLASWQQVRDDQPLPGLFDRVVTEIGYQSHLDDGSEEGRERWENVLELRRLAFEYAERGLVPFLENLALVSDQDTIPEQTEAPTLLTLHAAKGLEFTQVFIIGLDEGLLPHSRSLDDPEELAEERRLFYVGITRARDRLYLVRAEQRSSYGSFQDQIPSNFLRDIPDNLVQHQGQRRVQRRESMRIWNEPSSTGSRASTQPQQTPSRQPRYRINQRVRHPAWGEGLVVQSKIAEDGEETVDVFFESVGFKRLLASLANLEILS